MGEQTITADTAVPVIRTSSVMPLIDLRDYRVRATEAPFLLLIMLLLFVLVVRLALDTAEVTAALVDDPGHSGMLTHKSPGKTYFALQSKLITASVQPTFAVRLARSSGHPRPKIL